MPKGKYIRTKETIEKMRLAHLGKKYKPMSEQGKKNVSIAKKGKKGKSRIFTEAHVKNLSEAALRKPPEKTSRWKGGLTKDKEHQRKLHASYRENNRARYSFYSKHRAYVEKSVGGSHTFNEWEVMKAEYNWTCPCCKRSEPLIKLTADHIIPCSKGGSNNIENIQPLCGSCNSSKKTKTIKYEKI